MRIVIAGASGLVGRALVERLRAGGHEVVRLVRRESRGRDEIAWDPASGALGAGKLEGVGGMINLSGETLAGGRWTAQRRERILNSRIHATRTLVDAMQRMQQKPSVFLSASAAGYYGNRGEEVLTETSGSGVGFLADVCCDWESQALRAAQCGVRVGLLRFGLIVAGEGGALAKMLPLFRLGLGGRMGSGQQWTSWIAIDDVVGGICHAIEDERCAGPMNFVAPAAVTNAEFARSLGKVLKRPAWLPAPAWALRIAFGRGLADEALLSSLRVAPRRLAEVGYAFAHPTLESALEKAVLRS
jgi:uncharacterized protein (TIGR01777 family)